MGIENRADSPSNSDQPSAPKVINPDGSLNEGVLTEQYGLGINEAMQEVTFGSYRGTVAEMLDDPKCPVGGVVRQAYGDSGIDGVLKNFSLFSQMDAKFHIEISEETTARESQKKNLTGKSQIFPQQNQ